MSQCLLTEGMVVPGSNGLLLKQATSDSFRRQAQVQDNFLNQPVSPATKYMYMVHFYEIWWWLILNMADHILISKVDPNEEMSNWTWTWSPEPFV